MIKKDKLTHVAIKKNKIMNVTQIKLTRARGSSPKNNDKILEEIINDHK